MSKNNPLELGSLSSIAKMAVKKPVSEGERSFMALNKLKPDPNQPRKEFDPVYIQELSDSIREHGVLKSIRVSRQPDPADGLHIIYMGECRYRASLLAGKEDIPYEFDDNYDPYAQVVENEKQRPLRPHELALFIKARKAEGHTYAHMAQKLTIKENRVAKLAALIDWPSHIGGLYFDGMTSDVETLYMLVTLNKEYPAEVEAFCKKARAPEDVGRVAVKALKTRIQEEKVRQQADSDRQAQQAQQPAAAGQQEAQQQVKPEADTASKGGGTPKWLEEQRKRDADRAAQQGAAQQPAAGQQETAASSAIQAEPMPGAEEMKDGPRVLVKVFGKEAYLLLDASCEYGFARVAFTSGVEEEVLAEDLEVLAIV